MGTGVAMKRILAVAALVVLSSCGENAQDDVYRTAFQQLRGGMFNSAADGPEPFTATRASLRAAGITRPVLVVRIPTRGISAGLLEFRQHRGVTIWQSLDGHTLSTAGGFLRNTRGFGTDLHSLETAPAHAALARGDAAEYSRLFRALDGEGALQVARLYCQLQPQARERVDILGRGYDTTRYTETCHADGREAPVFENSYWRDQNGTIWKSRQWAGPELGYAELERVILDP